MKRINIKIIVKLFINMMYISAFTFGGGFVIVTFMKKKFVDEFKWIDEQEMLDLTALAQSSPGAIAVNAAILVGWRVAGFLGMAAAVIATVIPPLIIISIISLFYSAFATNKYVALVLKGMQAGVVAVILDVVLSLGEKIIKTKSIIHILIMLVVFIINFLFDINIVFIILGTAIIGIVLAVISKNKEKSNDIS